MVQISRAGLTIVSLIVILSVIVRADEKPAWTKKKITDYNDHDMQRLLDQWEVSHTNVDLPHKLLTHIFFWQNLGKT